jgi:hypothetical protein
MSTYPINPRFRLVFSDPSDTTSERVNQIFSQNYQDESTQQWINKTLAAGGLDSFLSIYQASETLVAFRKKPKPEQGK